MEHNGHGDMWVVSSGAVMGILMQVRNPTGNDFIVRAIVGGIVGALAAWFTKRVLDFIILPAYKWIKKKNGSRDYPVKRKRKY